MTYKPMEHLSYNLDEPFQELATGVIRQAAEDYRLLGNRLHNSSSQTEKKHIESDMKKISRFFLGTWYSVLSGLENGSDVLGRLDEEVFGND